MLKKMWTWTKHYLRPLKSSGNAPALNSTRTERAMRRWEAMPLGIMQSDEEVYRRNTQMLELAKFEQQRDAIDKNLLAQHRLMIATLLLAVVAVLSTVTAVIIALTAKPPTVNVQTPTSSVRH